MPHTSATSAAPTPISMNRRTPRRPKPSNYRLALPPAAVEPAPASWQGRRESPKQSSWRILSLPLPKWPPPVARGGYLLLDPTCSNSPTFSPGRLSLPHSSAKQYVSTRSRSFVPALCANRYPGTHRPPYPEKPAIPFMKLTTVGNAYIGAPPSRTSASLR